MSRKFEDIDKSAAFYWKISCLIGEKGEFSKALSSTQMAQGPEPSLVRNRVLFPNDVSFSFDDKINCIVILNSLLNYDAFWRKDQLF
jgi:hypothetical protein